MLIMKFNKSVYKKIFLILTIILVFFLLGFLVKKSLDFFNGFVKLNNKSEKIVKTNEPVLTDIYFNHATGSQEFSPLIVNEINKSHKSLEIAVYSFKSNDIKAAVYKAAERGVKVTLVLDFRKKGINDVLFLDLPSSIKRLDVGRSSSTYSVLMHHKFAIIDRGEVNERLIFGSNNWTDLQEEYDQSFLLLTSNHWLVNSFGHEFDRLAIGESGTAKLKDPNYDARDLNLQSQNAYYQVLFGPSPRNQGINSSIYNLLKGAKKDIKIMIWYFTDKNLAAEIINRAKEGIKISVIGDSFNVLEKSSVFAYLNEQKKLNKLTNLEILMDASSTSGVSLNENATTTTDNVDPFLHYHMLMIDDSEVLFGTNNWSMAGSYFNDESAIVTNDSKIINGFKLIFGYNYQKSSPVFK